VFTLILPFEKRVIAALYFLGFEIGQHFLVQMQGHGESPLCDNEARCQKQRITVPKKGKQGFIILIILNRIKREAKCRMP
jgi:hypothetical protein